MDFSNVYSHAQQFGIPTYTGVTFTYIGGGGSADDNIATATYTNTEGAVLGVLTYTYFGSTNNAESITRTA